MLYLSSLPLVRLRDDCCSDAQIRSKLLNIMVGRRKSQHILNVSEAASRGVFVEEFAAVVRDVADPDVIWSKSFVMDNDSANGGVLRDPFPNTMGSTAMDRSEEKDPARREHLDFLEEEAEEESVHASDVDKEIRAAAAKAVVDADRARELLADLYGSSSDQGDGAAEDGSELERSGPGAAPSSDDDGRSRDDDGTASGRSGAGRSGDDAGGATVDVGRGRVEVGRAREDGGGEGDEDSEEAGRSGDDADDGGRDVDEEGGGGDAEDGAGGGLASDAGPE